MYTVMDNSWLEKDLKAVDLGVLFALLSFENGSSRAAWPGHATIAKRAGCGENTVRRSLERLIEAGVVEKENRRLDSGRQTSNRYVIRRSFDFHIGGEPASTLDVGPASNMGDKPIPTGSDDEPDDERVGQILSFYGDLKPSLVARWLERYPDIDVVQEVEDASIWELANPSKAKKDKARFLNNWLRNAQSPRKAPSSPATASGGSGATEDTGKRKPTPWRFESDDGTVYPIHWWGWRYETEYRWSKTWPHWRSSRENAISQGCPPEDLEPIPIWGDYEGSRG